MLSIFRRIRQSLLKTGSFKRYFLYAIGEVILIVVGVLIAVSINSSNNFRVKRLQEQQIVVRISNELDASINRIAIFQRRLQRKEEALASLEPFLRGEVIEDKRDFLETVILASTFGWEQPPLEQTTFREILSSGQLSLILDTELRLQLTRFYHFVTQSEERSNLRMSEFPRVAYKLIPRETENELKESLSDGEITEIVAAVLKSDLKYHLTSEQNRARFIVDNWETMMSQSTELQSKLNARRRPGMLSETNFPSNPPSN